MFKDKTLLTLSRPEILSYNLENVAELGDILFQQLLFKSFGILAIIGKNAISRMHVASDISVLVRYKCNTVR